MPFGKRWHFPFKIWDLEKKIWDRRRIDSDIAVILYDIFSCINCFWNLAVAAAKQENNFKCSSRSHVFRAENGNECNSHFGTARPVCDRCELNWVIRRCQSRDLGWEPTKLVYPKIWRLLFLSCQLFSPFSVGFYCISIGFQWVLDIFVAAN